VRRLPRARVEWRVRFAYNAIRKTRIGHRAGQMGKRRGRGDFTILERRVYGIGSRAHSPNASPPSSRQRDDDFMPRHPPLRLGRRKGKERERGTTEHPALISALPLRVCRCSRRISARARADKHGNGGRRHLASPETGNPEETS